MACQHGGDSFHKGGGTVKRTLGNFVTHGDGTIVSLMATGLQIIEHTGQRAPEDFPLAHEPSGTFSNYLSMIPVVITAVIRRESEQRCDGRLKGRTIGPAHTRIKDPLGMIACRSVQVVLGFREESMPQASTSRRSARATNRRR